MHEEWTQALDEQAAEFRSWLAASGAARRQPGSAGGPWPEPEPISETLPPVPEFDERLLPDSFRPWVADIAERMQVPIDYPAAISVLALSGVVCRRALVQPKANDPTWKIVPNLWGGIIAPPGFLKSPVIAAVLHPLNAIQADWRRAHEDAEAEFKLAIEEFELARAAWKEQYKAALKKGKDLPERLQQEPAPPALRRLLVNDATFEALHQVMSENPHGVLVVRDELIGWWAQLDRAGREGERAFCLQAWNGDTGHTIDRIGRGTIHVEHCCMAMLGGIQPPRLRGYLNDALEDGPTNDGLIQRFQVLVWPDAPRDWRYVDRPATAELADRAGRMLRALADWQPETPALFKFDEDAQQLFRAWLSELEHKVRNDDLHPALVSHLAKYRKLMPALAVLFELADRAEGGFVSFVSSDSGQTQKIRLEHARRAAAWCDYLEAHAHRIYSCITTPQMRAASELAEKLKQGRIGQDGTISIREIYRRGWAGLDTPESARAALDILEDAGWVRPIQAEEGRQGGRPSSLYLLNPAVRSVQAKSEEKANREGERER